MKRWEEQMSTYKLMQVQSSYISHLYEQKILRMHSKMGTLSETSSCAFICWWLIAWWTTTSSGNSRRGSWETDGGTTVRNPVKSHADFRRQDQWITAKQPDLCYRCDVAVGWTSYTILNSSRPQQPNRLNSCKWCQSFCWYSPYLSAKANNPCLKTHMAAMWWADLIHVILTSS